MKYLLSVGGILLTVLIGRAETLSELFAPQGELILTQMESAPFPHPKRAEGHKYKDQFFPAKEHYTDNTVGIFIPKGFRETGRIDLVIHFHGWKNDVEGVLRRYRLVEQLVESGRNAVLVVPQGPRRASDSFGGKLEDDGGFKRFIDEVTATLRQKSALKRKDFAIGSLILSGHSGGYQVISAIVDHGGLTPSIKEVWLFDALYAQTDRFLAWLDLHQGRLLNIYTANGGTKGETERLIARLKQRGTPLVATNEAAVSTSDLQLQGPIFLYTDLAHNEVVDKRLTFQKFLSTSCLSSRTE